MTISTFDRSTMKMLAAEIAEAVQGIAEKHGIEIRDAGGRFEAADATIKLSLRALSDAAQDAKAVQVNEMLALMGLPACYGKKITNRQGEEFEIIDCSPNRPRFPLLARSLKDGRIFKFTADAAKRAA